MTGYDTRSLYLYEVKAVNEMMCKQNGNLLRQFINSLAPLNPIPSDETGSYIFRQSNTILKLCQ